MLVLLQFYGLHTYRPISHSPQSKSLVRIDHVVNGPFHVLLRFVFGQPQHVHAGGCRRKPIFRVAAVGVVTSDAHLRVHVPEAEQGRPVGAGDEEEEFLLLLVGK